MKMWRGAQTGWNERMVVVAEEWERLGQQMGQDGTAEKAGAKGVFT